MPLPSCGAEAPADRGALVSTRIDLQDRARGQRVDGVRRGHPTEPLELSGYGPQGLCTARLRIDAEDVFRRVWNTVDVAAIPGALAPEPLVLPHERRLGKEHHLAGEEEEQKKLLDAEQQQQHFLRAWQRMGRVWCARDCVSRGTGATFEPSCSAASPTAPARPPPPFAVAGGEEEAVCSARGSCSRGGGHRDAAPRGGAAVAHRLQQPCLVMTRRPTREALSLRARARARVWCMWIVD